MTTRELLKTRMVIYFAACLSLTVEGPTMARFFNLGPGSPHTGFIAICFFGAVAFLWAGLRELSRLKNST